MHQSPCGVDTVCKTVRGWFDSNLVLYKAETANKILNEEKKSALICLGSSVGRAAD